MQKFVNNWSSTLLAPADAADLEFAVDTTGLPALAAGDYYLLTVEQAQPGLPPAWEVVRVTAVGDGVLTLGERGAEGEALDLSAGSVIYCSVTAGTLARIGEGGITSIVQGAGITIDDTDPANPVISAPGGGGGGSDSGWVELDYIEARLLNGVVYLRGSPIIAASGEDFAVLPEGFRPSAQLDIPQMVTLYGEHYQSLISIYDASGGVRFSSGVPFAAAVYFDGISFPVG